MAKKRKRRYSTWFTEEVWQTIDDVESFCKGLQGLQLDGFEGITSRKCYLYQIASARRVMHLFPDELCRRVVQFCDCSVDEPELLHGEQWQEFYATVHDRLEPYGPAPDCIPRLPLDPLTESAYSLARDLLDHYHPEVRYLGCHANAVIEAAGLPYAATEHHPQLATLRDVFGNPFRPIAFSPAWRTDTVLSLAAQMYDSHDFSAMPILADAIQDADCDNTDILDHCRDPQGFHVRGCWVVDLILAKS
jgi:hypothetical protein